MPNLDMSRGKPCAEQLDLSSALLSLPAESLAHSRSGVDVRNYAGLDGLPETKAFFGALLEVPAENVLISGNSSLNLMYDTIARYMQFGVLGGEPWSKQGKLRWLCPAPGYDRHFAITELFGFEMIAVPMLESGPDMSVVERLVAADPSIKGIWCVPKYSNPTGITYSDETVRRMAALKPAASDFRVFWDNAYFVHDFTPAGDRLLNILAEAEAAGNPDLPLVFTSMSKVTFPGAAISACAASEKNLAQFRGLLSIQTIGPDKINQLRHLEFFDYNPENVRAHMQKHAAIIRPKFERVLEILERELGGIASFTRPNGGYFISVDLPAGTAKKTVALCKEAGVIFTPAGATFPYGSDPADSNIRIAPTVPSLEELEEAINLFCRLAVEAARS